MLVEAICQGRIIPGVAKDVHGHERRSMAKMVRLQGVGDHGVPGHGSFDRGMIQPMPLVARDHDEDKTRGNQSRAWHTAGHQNFALARLGAFAMVISGDVLNVWTGVIIGWLRLRVCRAQAHALRASI
jgi:hypothetical protein